jgi:Spy/CpxP family protein refolding chaperone
MKKSGLIVAAYLTLTFLSGAAVGGFGFWLYSTRSVSAVSRRPTPEEFRQRYLSEMRTRLNLSDDQVQKLTTILDSTRELFRQISDKHRPEYEAIQQHQREQVRAILNQEQRDEYEKVRAEREKKRKTGGFGPGPGF